MEKDPLKVVVALEEQERARGSELLEEILATTYGLYLKTQHYHWNVTGPQFYSLHLLFQNQYEEMAEAIDEIAERVRALGFFPRGAFSSFLKLSVIEEEIEVPPSMQMVERLLRDHQILIALMRRHLPWFEKIEDGATADLINKRLAFHEKVAWILRSTLTQI